MIDSDLVVIVTWCLPERTCIAGLAVAIRIRRIVTNAFNKLRIDCESLICVSVSLLDCPLS